MYRILFLTAGALIVTPLSAAELRGTSKIDAVTVFPAGAEVRRVASVKMDAGDHTLTFQDLPVQAIPSSIRVEGKASGRLEIGSVDTRRLSVAQGDAQAMAAQRRALEDELRGLRDQRAQVEADVEAAQQQKQLLHNLTELPSRGGNGGAGSGPAPREDWSAIVATVGKETAAAQRAILDAQVKLRKIDEDIKDREGKLKAQSPVVTEVTEVKVALAASSALDADLVILYQVGNAGWQPQYDARLSTGSRTAAPALTLSRRAQITQRTAESWDGVQLALSTTQPGRSSAAPELRPVTVDFEAERPPLPPPAPVAGAPAPQAMRSMAKTRAQVDEVASEVSPASVAAVERQADVVSAPFQAVFNIPGRVDVPNTGQAKRVAIEDAQVEPVLVVRTVPRVEAKAFLYAKLTLPKSNPYLPGPVALFRDQMFVGTGQLPQLAPGEDYELGFGSDDLVKVKVATLEERRGEGGLLSSTRTDQRNYRLSIKNMHERAVQLTVMDQVPVSAQQDIKVELIAKTAPSRQNVEDKRGILAWDDKLGPDEERVIDFGYKISWPGTRNITFGR